MCLDAQNLWGAVDFSGAHIMPCKNIKTLDLKIFRRIGKTKLHSEFQILYLMIYLLMDRETINCLHLNWSEEYLAPLQTLYFL